MTLTGKTALITGGTDGIGRAVVQELAQQGIGQMVVVGRSAAKSDQVRQWLMQHYPHVQYTFQAADLSLMQEVQRLAQVLQAQRFDYIVMSAGVMLRRRTLTAEGLETVFAVQYLARWLLLRELLPRLNAEARIVNISAGGETKRPLDFDNLQGEKAYSGVAALQHESIANDLQMLAWQARYPQWHFFCYGPGFVRTTLLRDMDAALRWFSATLGQLIAIAPEQAAHDVVTLLSGDFRGGLYKRYARPNVPTAFAADPAQQARLWQVSETLSAAALAADQQRS
jgi:NAD(P)-dependent dehydrogenase (short-subunit alcohol dehydrogenase family)